MKDLQDLLSEATTLGAARRSPPHFLAWTAARGVERNSPLYEELFKAYAEGRMLREAAELTTTELA